MSPKWGLSPSSELRSDSVRVYKFHVAAVCNNQLCRGINIAIGGSRYSIDPTSAATIQASAANAINHPEWIEWHPTSVSVREYVAVPDHIGEAAKEAHRCAATGSPMAAILMARTTLEATAKHKEITSGGLMQKLADMRDKGLIRPNIHDAADAIRAFGNDMAHGDIEERPSEADAQIVLKLMDLVLVEVFEGDALTREILEKRKPRGARAIPPSSQ